MSITTEHNGYVVVYSEQDDLWRCPQLGLEAEKLSTLRSKIETTETESRKIDARAFLFDHSGFSITPVLVVMADGDGTSAWVVNKLDNPRNERREKVDMNRLVEDTPENRQLLLAWRDASRAVYEEGQRVAQLRDAIPRMGHHANHNAAPKPDAAHV
ncbi:hypothetical protein OSH11_06490 [Kaistia dalseonensis]|uniref:Uncharacterized protein n=1 Tax=Kaistia dalseonensis TaxID=410840 RepID=A0ABU0H3Q3_9HYPH|nr:hypothetical protein [Kaistia dalseonensis]MCX5494341.1 hypothetical protein [Kaistia dalseonensis]MDQ0436922.1 hypothetical protein [Kaistia dalseonensis]